MGTKPLGEPSSYPRYRAFLNPRRTLSSPSWRSAWHSGALGEFHQNKERNRPPIYCSDLFIRRSSRTGVAFFYHPQLNACPDIALLRFPNDMVRRAECQCLNRHRRVIAAARNETAAVHDIQIRHIVGLVKLVDHRCLRVVAHPAGTAVVRTAARVV